MKEKKQKKQATESDSGLPTKQPVSPNTLQIEAKNRVGEGVEGGGGKVFVVGGDRAERKRGPARNNRASVGDRKRKKIKSPER